MTWHPYRYFYNFPIYAFIMTVLISCGGGGGGSSVVAGGGGCNAATSLETSSALSRPDLAINATYSISGRILPPAGTRVDSDVNDPQMLAVTNNSIATAQRLPNPATLGGFVSSCGSGESNSRYKTTVDRDDYYLAQLESGQTIKLNTAISNANLNLKLLDSSGTVVSSSEAALGELDTVTVPAGFTGSRDFYIQVAAVNGASNYTLEIQLVSPTFTELEQDFVPGEIIVRFKDDQLPVGVSEDSLHMRAGQLNLIPIAGAPGRSMLMRLGEGKQLHQMQANLNLQSNESVADPVLKLKLDTILTKRALAQRSDIVSARLNYIYQTSAIPNDEHYNTQWHYPLINLPQAWDITKGADTVIVAVIDTGVLLNHPDLTNKLVTGYDFVSNPTIANDGESAGIMIGGNPVDIDPNPNDPGDDGFIFSSTFHGTHVAGTIAAQTNNTTGVAGVGWNVKVMPLRALGKGGGTTYDIEQAVRYAARLANDSGTLPAQKADVINLSLGGGGSVSPTPEAYTLARAQGCLIFAAAGNESSSVPAYPASYDDAVISVGAVDITKSRAFYSNIGTHLDVVAPGGDTTQNFNGDSFPDGVFSTTGSDSSASVSFNYGLKQGTSMATPHVAGVAALMKSVRPALTPDEFVSALSNGKLTEDLGTAGRDNNYGHGLIDALSSVLHAQLLNAGNVVADDAYMAVKPGLLNFGTSLTTLSLIVSNTGNGTTPLTITSVVNDSGGWLTHTAPGGGLGEYIFTVDRSGLVDDMSYSATITIVSNVNTVTIPVIMQKISTTSTDNAGRQYVLLVRVSDSGILGQVALNISAGSYNYSFSGIPTGEYRIFSGSDLDNDGVICDPGESCGVFPETGTIELTSDLPNADFITSFGIALSTSALSSGSYAGGLYLEGIPLKRLSNESLKTP